METTPQEKLEKIIKDCYLNHISITGVGIHNDDQLYSNHHDDYLFKINGFSKSGVAEIFIENDKIICKTRYEKKDVIENFRDLAFIALQWYMDYKDSSPFETPDLNWAKVWENFGLVTIKTETKYIINYK